MNDAAPTPTSLRGWLDAAWGRHDSASRALADDLIARAPSLPDDAEGVEAVRLARHTMLGHLADATALRRFLDRLPRSPAFDAPRRYATWAADELSGAAPAPLPEAVRWGPVSDVALAEVALGRLDAVRARLFGAEAEATGHAEVNVRQGYAVACNGVAGALRDGPRGDPARDALMIDAAHLARRAWSVAGTWMNVERADYFIARSYAVIGQGEPALHHARECLRVCEAEGADAYERFFAHEALVHAHRAAGDAAGAATQRARMDALLAEVTDPGSLAYCRSTLAALDAQDMRETAPG